MTTRTLRLVVILAAFVGIGVSPSGPAQAAFPSENTIYRAQVVRGDGLAARIRIVVGEDRKTVAKVWVKASCENGSTVKIVRRNLPIDRKGGFTVDKLTKKGKLIYSVSGAWESKDVAFGEVDLPRCPPGGFGYLTQG